jgi:hypothetical protein
MRKRGFGRVIGCRIGLMLACGLLVSACASGPTGTAPVTPGTITESGGFSPARPTPVAATRAAAHPKAADRRQHRRAAATAAKSKPKPANRIAEKHPPPRETSPDVIPLD